MSPQKTRSLGLSFPPPLKKRETRTETGSTAERPCVWYENSQSEEEEENSFKISYLQAALQKIPVEVEQQWTLNVHFLLLISGRPPQGPLWRRWNASSFPSDCLQLWEDLVELKCQKNPNEMKLNTWRKDRFLINCYFNRSESRLAPIDKGLRFFFFLSNLFK